MFASRILGIDTIIDSRCKQGHGDGDQRSHAQHRRHAHDNHFQADQQAQYGVEDRIEQLPEGVHGSARLVRHGQRIAADGGRRGNGHLFLIAVDTAWQAIRHIAPQNAKDATARFLQQQHRGAERRSADQPPAMMANSATPAPSLNSDSPAMSSSGLSGALADFRVPITAIGSVGEIRAPNSMQSVRDSGKPTSGSVHQRMALTAMAEISVPTTASSQICRRKARNLPTSMCRAPPNSRIDNIPCHGTSLTLIAVDSAVMQCAHPVRLQVRQGRRQQQGDGPHADGRRQPHDRVIDIGWQGKSGQGGWHQDLAWHRSTRRCRAVNRLAARSGARAINVARKWHTSNI